MAELRHLLDKEQVEEMWTTKDGLRLLTEDPLNMYKGKFVEYLEVKSEALLEDYLSVGLEHDEAMAKVRADLTAITAEWKAEAKRRSQGK